MYMMKVLFLTPWYPHRYDAMSGLFVRKHAQAVVRQGVEVGVISMYHEPSITHNEIVDEMVDGVREVILYTKKSGIIGELEGLRRLWQYWPPIFLQRKRHVCQTCI